MSQYEVDDRLIITPFEKNIEIWRQLWIVVERSDLIVQIIDSRNPLLFFNEDIFLYSKALNPGKENMLLLNKADLLPEEAINAWHEYFEKKQIPHIFYSASSDTSSQCDLILDADELLEVCKKCTFLFIPLDPSVGFVGFPNVGKSTTLNSLLKQKKSATSETPGKTKHFQTFHIDNLKLFDCPGLVFPSFASSKDELIVQGVLSHNHLTDYVAPITFVTKHLDVSVFENTYSLPIGPLNFKNPSDNAMKVLEAIAKNKGYVNAGSGNPDVNKISRLILGDLLRGRILFFQLPPS